jgi:hypothetical protein
MFKRFTRSLLLIGVLAGAATPAMAWTERDTAWQIAYLAAHIADWGQTRDIASQCEQGLYYETNPILGRCPSHQWVNAYFLGTALLHAGVASALPSKMRRLFQAGTLAMELNYVSNNANIGLRINF